MFVFVCFLAQQKKAGAPPKMFLTFKNRDTKNQVFHISYIRIIYFNINSDNRARTHLLSKMDRIR